MKLVYAINKENSMGNIVKSYLRNMAYIVITLLRILYFIPFLRWFAWLYAFGCVFMAIVAWQIPSMTPDRNFLTIKAILVNLFIWLCIFSAHCTWSPKTDK